MAKHDIYRLLKQDIRRRYWPPGQPLSQQMLAAHYQTSRIPVREAMARLEAEGWLVRHGKASLQVPALTVAEAAELTMLRLALEPLALELAARQMTHAQLGAAQDLLTQATQLPASDPLAHGELNWQFHRTLYQSCQQPFLLQLLEQLHDKAAMYLALQEVQFGYAAQSQLEHIELLELLRQGQVERAVQCLRQHIQVAADSLQQQLGAIS